VFGDLVPPGIAGMTDLSEMSSAPVAPIGGAARAAPTRSDAVVFGAKAALLRIRRLWHDVTSGVRPDRHSIGASLTDAPVIAHIRSPLWASDADPQEWALTAGKVQNLRIAARHLDGVEVPAFSASGVRSAAPRVVAVSSPAGSCARAA